MPKTSSSRFRGVSECRIIPPVTSPTGFRCPHCPFQGRQKDSLGKHLGHHTTKLAFQCPHCTFSVPYLNNLVRHIRRVHPEETIDNAVLKKKAEEWRAVAAIPDLGAQETQPAVGVEGLPNEEAELVNEMPPLEMEVTIEVEVEAEDPPNERAHIENAVALSGEIMDGAKETEVKTVDPLFEEAAFENAVALTNQIRDGAVETENQESDDEVMIIEPDPPNPWCPECRKPIVDEQEMMINCFMCESCFHGSCVGGDMELETQWLCPVCVTKKSPTSHLTKLIKAVNSFSQVYHDGQVSSGPSISSNSYDGSGETEETRCREELAQLDSTIRSSWAELVLVTKKAKEDAPLFRASRATELREEMDKLHIVDQGISFQLAVLLEAKDRNQKEEGEQWRLKMKAEEELSHLRKTSFRQVKEEVVGGTAASLEETEEGKMENLLDQLEEKLAEIEREGRSLKQRIKETGIQVSENKKKLAVLRGELEKLRTISGFHPSTPVAARISKLKTELRDRVNRFSVLLTRLVQLNARLIIADIHDKEKEWLEICFNDGV